MTDKIMEDPGLNQKLKEFSEKTLDDKEVEF